MIFEQHVLTGNLTKYIESIFYFKDFIPEHSKERVVPTGHVFLIFELDGIERNTFDPVDLTINGSYENAWISGMHKNHLSISAHPNSEMLVVQFKAIGAFPFLGMPLSELANKVVDAKDYFGESIIELRNLMIEKESIKDKFLVIEEWLHSKFDLKKVPNNEFELMMNSFLERPLTEHKVIIEQYSKTQKHLIDQIKKYCGLTPKVLHRIFRFNEILAKIHNEKNVDWSQIAYLCGYTDQSHFIKEFKEFSGFNPQEFIKNDYHEGEPNFFPLKSSDT